ncbi:S41 family peptidase [Bacteroidota bacterium]
MNQIIRLSVCFLFLLFFSNNELLAQDKEITIKYKENAVIKIVRLIKENYILKNKRDTITKGIIAKFHSGSYNAIYNLVDFANELTKDLHDISGDKHFAVVYDPIRVADMRKEEEEPDKVEQERIEKRRIESQRTGNFGFKKVEILDGNIGYLDLRFFRSVSYAAETAHGAMAFLFNSDAIIIDLRNNPGGGAGMYKLLASYFFGEDTIHLGNVYNGLTDRIQEFWTLPKLPGKRMPDKDLYILTSKKTFSAAEEFAYDLKHLNRAIIVGESTGGGAHMVTRLEVNDEFYIFMPFAGAINPITKSNWEGIGVQPHYVIKSDEALKTAQILILKKLINESTDEEYKMKLETLLQNIN